MSKRGWLLMICGLLSVLMVLSVQVQADGAALQLTPRPTLIPLPTATPIYVAATGATIELHTLPNVWTVMEWQDGLGAWHTVEGWQGKADEQGNVRWWVAPAQLGSGPFRWAVYDEPNGALLAASQPFDLPSRNRQWVVVEVKIQ